MTIRVQQPESYHLNLHIQLCRAVDPHLFHRAAVKVYALARYIILAHNCGFELGMGTFRVLYV